LRIGIECSTLTRWRAGIGFYNYQLVRALAEQEGDEEFVLLYNRPLPDMLLPSRLRHVLSGPGRTLLWSQFRLSSLCRRHGIDLLHSPGQGLPLLYDGNTILTVHDLSPLIYPEQKELKSRFVWYTLVPMMARQANHIITVSHHTRQDVINLLGIPEERVTCIYEAPGPEFYPVTDENKIQMFLKERNLQSGYILAVGTLEPRKNYPFLFRVFKRWLETSGANATLVIIGGRGWLYNEIFETHAALNLGDRVRFMDYVEDMEEIRLFYSAARFFMLAPIYEGFWLPGLEALACGTPVIAPRHSSIAEVVGAAGLLLDSYDEEEWVPAMNHFWDAPDRQDWVRNGLEHVKQFSWQKAARETLEVYRRVFG
jgi:glycosyltransferase involved in cell wall biosynthesis